MNQLSSQKSVVVEKLQQIADIIAVSDAKCVRCGKEIDFKFVIYRLLERDLDELRKMKAATGFLCCECMRRATATPRYEMDTSDHSVDEGFLLGLSNFLSLSPEVVRNSIPYRKYVEIMSVINQDKVRFYRIKINDRKRRIKKYQRLISKHKRAIKTAKDESEIIKRKSTIEEYERRIKMHKRAIKWLEFLIEMEEVRF